MDIRNIAIIAHVDHGKTTLVDAAAAPERRRSAPTSRSPSGRSISNELERERGITILAKCTSVVWQRRPDQHRRHARPCRFRRRGRAHPQHGRRRPGAGRRRRGPDAADQVRRRQGAGARACGRSSSINKVDRPDARPIEVHNEIFDLFAAARRERGAARFPDAVRLRAQRLGGRPISTRPRKDLSPLFELILAHVPPPGADADAPFSMLATTLDYDPYLGRVLTGLIHSGVARVNMPVKSLRRDGRVIEQARLTKLLAYRGLERRPIEEARAGDIIAVAGLDQTTVADTICAPEVIDAARRRSDRPADPGDDLLGQRQPARRPRGRAR